MRLPCLALAALLAGCAAESPAWPEEALVCGETFRDIPVPYDNQLDLLFVIDTSPSMAGEQDSLARNFVRFANVLESFEGGLPSLHAAVVTSDLGAGSFEVAGCSGNGDDGRMHAPAGCGVAGSFLIDHQFPDGTRERNYAGEFADALACVARVGVGTCEFAQPLAAALRALGPDHPEQAGFLRPAAYLGVIVITDGDDCSAADPALFDPARTDLGPPTAFRCFEHGVRCDPDEPRLLGEKRACAPRSGGLLAPVGGLAATLRGLKEEPDMVTVAVVAGPDQPVVVSADVQGRFVLLPSCTSATGEATPAVRLHDLADRFPARDTVTSICNADLSDALVLYAPLLSLVLGNPCLEGDIDRDPDTPGTQAECVVSDVRFPGEDRRQETLIPPCPAVPPAAGDRPCWHLVEDRAACPDTDTGTVLVIERHDYPPSGTHVQARCRILC